MPQTYYDILGVSKDASQKEIRAAYRRLAREYHPDVNPGNAAAEEKFKLVNEAYHILNDPKSRRDYDEFGENWKHADEIRKMGGSGTRRSRSGGGSIFDVFGVGEGAFDLGDLFGMGMGGHNGGFGANAAVQGSLDITLEEAYNGTTRRVSLGTPTGSKTLEVKVPAGIHDGRRITLTTDGVQVALTVNVLPHHRFRRDGDNLHIDVDVPLYDAMLGGEVEVPTMTGRVMLRIPAGTQNGRSFRVSGKGMPVLNSDRRGDLIATVRVRLPESLSDEEKELLGRLRAMREPAHGSGRR